MSDRMGQTNGCAVARGDTQGLLNALPGISFQLTAPSVMIETVMVPPSLKVFLMV